MTSFIRSFAALFVALGLFLTGCTPAAPALPPSSHSVPADAITDAPAYTDSAYVELNDNQPNFTEADYTTDSFETYSPLDALGRCGVAFANISVDLMPTEERGSIGQIKPSGWHTVKYDFVDGKYLYNRCHLIGYQLTAENANEENLITGTRYLNIHGMLPFENMVADYVQQTENHVLYRVTPVFEGNNLVASGVQIEAYSVEDKGEGICFNVYCYNVQPGVQIDYATGTSQLTDAPAEGAPAAVDTKAEQYVLNTSSKRFHLPECSSVPQISEHNRKDFTGSANDLVDQGYKPCGQCLRK